jgi:hypothetical protein
MIKKAPYAHTLIGRTRALRPAGKGVARSTARFRREVARSTARFALITRALRPAGSALYGPFTGGKRKGHNSLPILLLRLSTETPLTEMKKLTWTALARRGASLSPQEAGLFVPERRNAVCQNRRNPE